MACFEFVPVVEVDIRNFQTLYPSIVKTVRDSTFIALDAEFSGLGSRKGLKLKQMEERYLAMREMAATRSVISIGLSCFQLHLCHDNLNNAEMSSNQTTSALNSVPYLVHTYNFMLLSTDDYILESNSAQFLVQHGFDFNTQYAHGISYTPGNDEMLDIAGSLSEATFRNLFVHLALSHVPIVLHNGVVDLIFLYQHFFASLPPTLPLFIANTASLLCGGVLDTKYVAEYQARCTSSYLEYVFRKCQRENAVNSSRGKGHVSMRLVTGEVSSNFIGRRDCALPGNWDHVFSGEERLAACCSQFANHGWCPEGRNCRLSHDIDIVLDTENLAKARKRLLRRHAKRPRLAQANDVTQRTAPEAVVASGVVVNGSLGSTTVSEPHVNESPKRQQGKQDSESDQGRNGAKKDPAVNSSGSCHKAGFDSFMTGFTLAFYLLKYGNTSKKLQAGRDGQKLCLHDFGIGSWFNQVFLTGKDFPLQLAQSEFTKTSRDHADKMAALARLQVPPAKCARTR